ncbi:putative N-acetylated-alpha-linked acidic dipeptidase [Lytechinus variegatus]|uniref:putative N-acetylated-alpha-linked acidic dipeptidase n=1 Tax=Lytechinus variegatus TaxID=7654 RepID=UPI001BB1E80A|nr:putative N-acetylated-alpha-linked acidic dipeptidase [Lytechinus variegatus]
MGGEEVQSDWAGSLPLENGYRYGPGFADQHSNMSVKISVFTKNVQGYAWNVIGVIPGSIEPDRYVLVGNHRDAWAFGALDPSSGTACMLELSRAVGVLVNNGWKPRRSIMFCSWGAEEQGLIGSHEWVEEFTKTLGIRVVAYINVDVSLYGTWVPDIVATPNLARLIREASKVIPDPDPEGNRQTVYDTWKARGTLNEDDEPYIGTPGSGSDHGSLLHMLGVSALDALYDFNREEVPIRGYPMYHSVYETFDLVSKYYDPSFKYMLAVGQLIGEVMRQLADTVIIPMDVADYASAVEKYFIQLRDGDIGSRMTQQGLSFEYMESAVNNLTIEAYAFKERLNHLDLNDILAVRTVNDQIMYLDRMFIDPMGLSAERKYEKHVILAPSSKNSYAGEKFAGIVDAMFEIDTNPDPEKWDYVKMELAQVTYFIQSAAYMLQPV